MVNLLDRRDDYPYELSGGMRRRAQFVSGVASRPDLLLLDEPFSSVDEPTRVGIHQDVFDIIHGSDMTGLLVTHDLAEAVTLCDRVLVLSRSPALVADEHVIGFGNGRHMLDIRQSRDYQTIYSGLWGSLASQIRAGSGSTSEAVS